MHKSSTYSHFGKEKALSLVLPAIFFFAEMPAFSPFISRNGELNAQEEKASSRKAPKARSQGGSGYSQKRKKKGRWTEEDISEHFPELKVLDEVTEGASLRKLKLAAKFYNSSISRLKAASKEIELQRIKFAGRTYQYDWKKKDAEARLARIELRIRNRTRGLALTDLYQSIQTLAGIRNPQILKSSQCIDLTSRVYKQYVALQVRSRNLGVIIPILEQYLKLKPEHKKDPEPYRLLAAGYSSREKRASQMRNIQAARRFRKKKYLNLMKYVELKFGKSSPEYKRVNRRVKLEIVGLSG